MNTVIDQAAQKTSPIVQGSDSLSPTREKLARATHGLLPIESSALEAAKGQVAVIDRQIKQTALLKVMPDLQILDTEPFTWRDKHGLPQLLPFDVSKEGTTWIAGESGFIETFPKCCEKFYHDVQRGLSNLTTPDKFLPHILIGGSTCGILIGLGVYLGKSESPSVLAALAVTFVCGLVGLVLSYIAFSSLNGGGGPKAFASKQRFISAQFTGVIPEKTREKIAVARQHFTNVFILAETPGLEIKTRGVPQPSLEGDPLVVGFLDGTFYLVDKFDTTTLEQRIADNYALLP